ncbi:MAG TPA: hypothetical protein VK771_04955 [Acidimicrobiia bacterium]|nr:hypothetical protein [Acidimicrobiia bacterium]
MTPPGVALIAQAGASSNGAPIGVQVAGHVPELVWAATILRERAANLRTGAM